MRKKLFLIGTTSFLLTPAFSVIVVAQQATPTTTTAEPTKTITQRIEERKAAQKAKLDTAAQTKIKGRCKAAQTLVTVAQKKAETAGHNRLQAYEAIDSKLTKIIERLSAKQVDTTELTSLKGQLKTKSDAFKAQITVYQQNIDDLAAMDCVTDPQGFKATLDTTRAERAKLASQSAEIKVLLTQISKALKTAGQSLRPAITPGAN